MNDVKLDSVWASRDYPVLLEATRRIDKGEIPVHARDLAEVTGLGERDVRRAFAALVRRGLLDQPISVMDNEVGPMAVCDVSGAAYLMTGLHPDGDDALSGLVSALRQAAEESGDEVERGRLRAAADALLGLGRDVGAGVLTAFLTRYAGG